MVKKGLLCEEIKELDAAIGWNWGCRAAKAQVLGMA